MVRGRLSHTPRERSLTPMLWISHSLSNEPLRFSTQQRPHFYTTLRRVAMKTCLDVWAHVAKSKLLPFLILTDAPDRIWRWLFHEHPEHDGCRCRQGIPKSFYVSILVDVLAHCMVTDDTPGHCLPSKDILCVVVSQVHFSRPTYWDSYSFSIIRFQKIRC